MTTSVNIEHNNHTDCVSDCEQCRSNWFETQRLEALELWEGWHEVATTGWNKWVEEAPQRERFRLADIERKKKSQARKLVISRYEALVRTPDKLKEFKSGKEAKAIKKYIKEVEYFKRGTPLELIEKAFCKLGDYDFDDCSNAPWHENYCTILRVKADCIREDADCNEFYNLHEVLEIWHGAKDTYVAE